MNRKYLSLAVFLAIVTLVSAFGAMFETGQWYAELVKPGWNPPDWVFAPVWSTLYLLMAISAWLAWNSDLPGRDAGIVAWVVQLVLNGAWSWLFFGLNRPGWALAELTLLIVALVITMRRFHRLSRVAAWLLAPYLAWVLFAWVLNLTLWRLTGGGFGTVFG